MTETKEPSKSNGLLQDFFNPNDEGFFAGIIALAAAVTLLCGIIGYHVGFMTGVGQMDYTIEMKAKQMNDAFINKHKMWLGRWGGVI